MQAAKSTCKNAVIIAIYVLAASLSVPVIIWSASAVENAENGVYVPNLYAILAAYSIAAIATVVALVLYYRRLPKDDSYSYNDHDEEDGSSYLFG